MSSKKSFTNPVYVAMTKRYGRAPNVAHKSRNLPRGGQTNEFRSYMDEYDEANEIENEITDAINMDTNANGHSGDQLDSLERSNFR